VTILGGCSRSYAKRRELDRSVSTYSGRGELPLPDRQEHQNHTSSPTAAKKKSFDCYLDAASRMTAPFDSRLINKRTRSRRKP
jgi:hypothetical protein